MKSVITDKISPLRYPGSKQRTATYLEKILSFNAISPDLLVEPFVGGGSVFLKFLLHGICEFAVIADRDPLIYSFWKVVFEKTDTLISFIEDVKVDLDTFYYYKRVVSNRSITSIEELSKACIFLNRTSFSGIMSSDAGPIGGRNQASRYKIDCRFQKKTLIDKISFISSLKDRVAVRCSNWLDTLRSLSDFNEKNRKIFTYLDPPFYCKGEELYRYSFSKTDHKNLRDYLLNLKNDWILSYDNSEEVVKLYSNSDFQSLHIDVPYSINSTTKRIEKELIITPLQLPATI